MRSGELSGRCAGMRGEVEQFAESIRDKRDLVCAQVDVPVYVVFEDEGSGVGSVVEEPWQGQWVY